MDGRDLKFVVILLAILGGGYYLMTNWHPKPNYTGAPPNYGSKKPTITFTTDPSAPTFSEHQRQRYQKLRTN